MKKSILLSLSTVAILSISAFAHMSDDNINSSQAGMMGNGASSYGMMGNGYGMTNQNMPAYAGNYGMTNQNMMGNNGSYGYGMMPGYNMMGNGRYGYGMMNGYGMMGNSGYGYGMMPGYGMMNGGMMGYGMMNGYGMMGNGGYGYGMMPGYGMMNGGMMGYGMMNGYGMMGNGMMSGCGMFGAGFSGQSMILPQIMMLDLSKEQLEKIENILNSGNNNFTNPLDAFTESGFDKNTYIKAIEKNRETILSIHAEKISKIYSILTSEQKKNLKKTIDIQKKMMDQGINSMMNYMHR